MGVIDTSTTCETVAVQPSLNIAAVIGEITAEPLVRELPSGGAVMSLSIRVRSEQHATTSVPVLVYEPRKTARAVTTGDEVLVVGRVTRRFFHAGGRTQSRTELVADRLEPIRRRATCRRALAQLEELVQATVLESFV